MPTIKDISIKEYRDMYKGNFGKPAKVDFIGIVIDFEEPVEPYRFGIENMTNCCEHYGVALKQILNTETNLESTPLHWERHKLLESGDTNDIPSRLSFDHNPFDGIFINDHAYKEILEEHSGLPEELVCEITEYMWKPVKYVHKLSSNEHEYNEEYRAIFKLFGNIYAEIKNNHNGYYRHMCKVTAGNLKMEWEM